MCYVSLLSDVCVHVLMGACVTWLPLPAEVTLQAVVVWSKFVLPDTQLADSADANEFKIHLLVSLLF
jgi:hypothetical protein